MCSLKADNYLWTNPRDENDKRFKMKVDVCDSYINDCSPLWAEIKRLSNTFHSSHSFKEFRVQLDLISKSISMNSDFWDAIQRMYLNKSQRTNDKFLCNSSMDV